MKNISLQPSHRKLESYRGFSDTAKYCIVHENTVPVRFVN